MDVVVGMAGFASEWPRLTHHPDLIRFSVSTPTGSPQGFELLETVIDTHMETMHIVISSFQWQVLVDVREFICQSGYS